MDLREVGYDDRDWINLAQDRDRWRAYHRKLPSICSYWVEKKPQKNLNQITCPDRESNPCHLVLRPDSLTITPQEEEKELVGSLAEKKLPTEGCTGRNGEREKNSGWKKISDDRQH
ncbi:hypothetical protein ANN_06066 [Periplaneta americana]|uniref:Uncharacterized protein n=1 Tax=Periplaneta americana TaxID=6978 RepID=A0ABQ8TEA7_PERAM|nr:hypothetical protein ANN_06066 [Periplaneta americana]